MLHQTNMASNERNYTETGKKILSKESSKKKSKIADKCNKYFTNAGTAFASKIPKLPKM